MRYFQLDTPSHEVRPRWKGQYRARHAWRLPSIECTTCGQTWGGMVPLPGVDLSGLPERRALEDVVIEPFAQYAGLAERVRSLLPEGIAPQPGMQFGPLRGTARGRFGPLTLGMPWEGLVREDALEALHGAGLRGVDTVRAELKGLGHEASPLHELAPPLAGKVHPDCLLEGPPCSTCGWRESRLLSQCWLDANELPDGLDVFRLKNAETYLVVSERFVEAMGRLEPSDVVYRELGIGQPLSPARPAVS